MECSETTLWAPDIFLTEDMELNLTVDGSIYRVVVPACSWFASALSFWDALGNVGPSPIYTVAWDTDGTIIFSDYGGTFEVTGMSGQLDEVGASSTFSGALGVTATSQPVPNVYVPYWPVFEYERASIAVGGYAAQSQGGTVASLGGWRSETRDVGQHIDRRDYDELDAWRYLWENYWWNGRSIELCLDIATGGRESLVSPTADPLNFERHTPNLERVDKTSHKFHLRQPAGVTYQMPSPFSITEVFAITPVTLSFDEGTPTVCTSVNDGYWVPPTGWSAHEDYDGGNSSWYTTNAGSSSTATGATAPYDTGWCGMFEGSLGNYNLIAGFEYDSLDLTTALGTETVKFRYSAYGADMGTFNLLVEDLANPGVWDNLHTFSGQQHAIGERDDWDQISVSLAAYLGKTIRVRFEYLTGSNFNSDLFLDAIIIES